MRKVLVLVPFAFDNTGLDNRKSQQTEVELGPDIQFDYRCVKANPALYDSDHDDLLAEMSVYEAGITAQDEGYDAVCIDAMNDPGMNALRSVLDIPVIGPGRASYLTAVMLGNRFSIITYGDPDAGRLNQPYPRLYRKGLEESGVAHRCASIRLVATSLDVENLLYGKEDDVLPKFVDAGLRCVEDGADVICLGSTTMHGIHARLAESLPVPVINPGPLTYKVAETVLGLGLAHSRAAHPKPRVPKFDMAHAMMDAAAASEPVAVFAGRGAG